jgi:hypothetical protein
MSADRYILPDLRRGSVMRELEAWLHRQGVTLEELQSPGRRPFQVEARRHAARFLRAEGWSWPAIGDYLRRDHSTIMALVRGRRRYGRVPPRRP